MVPVIFSFSDFSQSVFSLLILFTFSCLDKLYSLLATVCVFIDLFKGFIPFLFKDINHNHKGYFKKYFTCTSAML